MEIINTLLFPITSAMENLYRLGFDITLNEGAAIILMSLFFNFITLPFYYMSEAGKSTVQKLQEKMKDEISSIKKHYKGRERHFYIKAIHARYGFHPGLALKASVGLLIQIPFFLAAYYYLSHTGLLSGISFGLISDLSQPDNLLFGTALLPWCMIITNLLSAYFYPGKKTAKDTWQLWLMALAFFILLYNESSALLLYWTTSNIFSLVKNIAEKILPMFSVVQYSRRVFHSRMIAIIDKICQKKRAVAMVAGLLFVAGIVISVYLEDSKTAPNIAWLFVNVLTWGMLGLVLWRVTYRFAARVPNPVFKALIQLCVLFSLMMVIVDLASGMLFPSNGTIIVNINLYHNAVASLLLLNVLLAIGLMTSRLKCFAKTQVPSYIFAASIAALMLLLFVVNPLLFFNSTDEFILRPDTLVLSSLGLAITISLWGYVMYLALHPHWRGLASVITMVLLVIALSYSFFIHKDFGLMTQFAFDPGAALSQGVVYSTIEVIVLIIVALCVYGAIVRFPKTWSACLLGALVMMVSFIAVNFPKNTQAQVDLLNTSTSNRAATILDNSPLHAYSQKENILVFILDAFSGTVLDYLLKQDEKVFDDYQGFIWYRNTLSVSLATWSSIGEMLGGRDYSVEAINKRNSKSIRQELNDAYNVLPQAFLPYNWQVSYYGMQYAKKFNERVNITSFDYGKHYLQTYQNKLYADKKGFNEKSMLYIVSLFRSSPLMFKSSIYDDGKWMGVMGKSEKLLRVYRKAESWGFLRAMESEMRVSAKKPTLKVFHFQLPHRPNLVNSVGKLQTESVPFVTESKVVLLQIANILQKMKELGVYDKSKIILISDHGYYYGYMQYLQHDSGFSKGFTDNLPKDTLNRLQPSRLHALLMVKDFNARGGVQTSNTFMSNGDLLAIICEVLENNCGKNLPDPTKESVNRTLSIYSTPRPDYGKDTQYKPVDIYRVKDSIFELANWNKY